MASIFKVNSYIYTYLHLYYPNAKYCLVKMKTRITIDMSLW